jgi:hypothetical protein
MAKHYSNNMKKLFVDDIRNAPDESWMVARTITAAISAIATFDFDVISLDHDISHQVVMGGISRPYPCEETFTPVAQFIAAKYQPHDHSAFCFNGSKTPKIIIHTSNPAGALRIAGHLQGFEIERKESVPANRLETEV